MKKKGGDPVIQSVYIASCFAELPVDMQKKIKVLKIDETQINANWETFIYILRHVTKDSYRIPHVEIQRSERYPNVSEEMRKKKRWRQLRSLTKKKILKKFLNL